MATKKTKKRYVLSKREWAKLQKCGQHTLFFTFQPNGGPFDWWSKLAPPKGGPLQLLWQPKGGPLAGGQNRNFPMGELSLVLCQGAFRGQQLLRLELQS